MDITVLPNNNHPEKFLQLDVGMLPVTHSFFQLGAAMSRQRQWHNRLYYQNDEQVKSESLAPPPEDSTVVFVDRYLEKHITPVTLKSNIKRNPLYSDIRPPHPQLNPQATPSWTVKDFDSHRDLEDYLKQEKTPTDLDFWLEDQYTPGFDSLLKKTEAEQRRKHVCKMVSVLLLSVCVLIVVITVPVVVSQGNN